MEVDSEQGSAYAHAYPASQAKGTKTTSLACEDGTYHIFMLI